MHRFSEWVDGQVDLQKPEMVDHRSVGDDENTCSMYVYVHVYTARIQSSFASENG